MKSLRPNHVLKTAGGLLVHKHGARLAPISPAWAPATANARTASTSVSVTTHTPRDGATRLVSQRAYYHHTVPRFSAPPAAAPEASSSAPSPSSASTPNNTILPSPAPDLQPAIHAIFEPVTQTWQYIVVDPTSLTAAIIDPVLDYEPATGTVSTHSADALLALSKEKGYTVSAILETHAHADHLTAASYMRQALAKSQTTQPAVPVCIGSRIPRVQSVFSTRYSIPFPELNGVFDRFLGDDEAFRVGNLACRAIHIPGHTPDHMGYAIGPLDVFVGDSIFHPELGTARCDFPGGDAAQLFESTRKLLTSADPDTRLWYGHDYPSPERGQEVACMTVREHRETNKHLKDGVSEEEFVEMRNVRDKSLAAPRLLHESLQVNVRGGHLPKPKEWGQRMLQHALKVEGGMEF